MQVEAPFLRRSRECVSISRTVSGAVKLSFFLPLLDLSAAPQGVPLFIAECANMGRAMPALTAIYRLVKRQPCSGSNDCRREGEAKRIYVEGRSVRRLCKSPASSAMPMHTGVDQRRAASISMLSISNWRKIRRSVFALRILHRQGKASLPARTRSHSIYPS